MPIFEYECNDCHKQVEVLVRGSETPECPACESKSLRKLLSVVATPAVNGSTRSSPAGGRCDTSLPPCSPTCCRLPN